MTVSRAALLERSAPPWPPRVGRALVDLVFELSETDARIREGAIDPRLRLQRCALDLAIRAVMLARDSYRDQ